jgi:hypothetical protein
LARLSFISHPFETLLKQVQAVTPGLERAIAIYFDAKNDSLKVVECFENGEISPLAFDETIVLKERKKVKPYDWIRKSDMPFMVKENGVEQLTISDELKNNILVMRFNNAFDNQSDIVYLYFNEHFGNFRLSKTDDSLTSSAKNIIQSLLYKTWHEQIKQMQQDYSIWHTLQRAENLRKTSTDKLEKENNLLQHRLKNTIEGNVNYLLKKLRPDTGSIKVSQKAIEKIIDLNLSVEQLEKLLEQALVLAENTALLTSNIIITENEIIPELIQFTEEDNAVKQEEEQVEVRYQKTKSFLDRYEKAAELLKKQNKPITGANIGSACSPTVSHAAISDVLKKHRNKIISLLQKHPDKWPILRSEFRSIKNLVPSNTSNNKLGQTG